MWRKKGLLLTSSSLHLYDLKAKRILKSLPLKEIQVTVIKPDQFEIKHPTETIIIQVLSTSAKYIV